jgi:hypothetical protein
MQARAAWNAGKNVGTKRPLTQKQIWAIRFHLDREGQLRDKALFDLAIDNKLRGLRQWRFGRTLSSQSQRGARMIDFKNGSFFKLKASNEYADKVTDLLIEGERVIGAFKALRDGVVFTDKRIIAVNVQGITGKKKDYTSLPYSKIVVFSVETAGTFDLDSELELYFSGLGKVKFDFTGQTDVAAIARTIGGFVL